MSSDTITPLENAQLRIFRDIWQEAQSGYWERRADLLEFALPRPGDFTGAATSEEMEARRRRLQASIEACRNHARILRGGELHG